MRFEIFTLFPDFFESPFNSSILKRARESGKLEVGVHDIRDGADDKHRTCDDAPYGGGAGMVMKAEPVARVVADVLKWDVGVEPPPCPVILMSPQGRPLTQAVVEELSAQSQIALLCAHYEGLDERAVELLVTDEISIGDYVLTGGEVAALVVVDAVSRMVPGVLGNEKSAQHDSFADGLLEAPHYTRPLEWRGKSVPDVLMSGHHAHIERWRRDEGFRRTWLRRPDLIRKKAEKRELAHWQRELLRQWNNEALAKFLQETEQSANLSARELKTIFKEMLRLNMQDQQDNSAQQND
jgi:tRNA (guanine37-N1)-methyltransferase